MDNGKICTAGGDVCQVIVTRMCSGTFIESIDRD